jgi:hypothetical protein
MTKVIEHAQIDVAVGPPMPYRIRTLTPMQYKGLHCGPKGEGLTQNRFLEHWGAHLAELTAFALARFRALGQVVLNGKNVPWNPEFKATLFVINYDKLGKYGPESVAIPWELLRKDGEPPKVQFEFPTLPSAPSTWWPVVHLWLPGSYHSPSERVWIRTASGWVICVVCIFQWTWDMPTGWNAQVARWSRM